MSVTVRDKDRGWKDLLRDTKRLKGEAVLVGLHGDMAERGGYNEFGTKRIPERSFIRSAFDENRNELVKLVQSLYVAIQDKTISIDKALGLIGETHQGQIQNKISSNVPPPNAPVTVKAKGSSGTLIDTGQMRQSVRWVIERLGFGGNN